MLKKILFTTLLFSLNALFAFSTTNIEYLYGNFDGNSGFDTKGGKSTLTVENFSTFTYGDFFGFVDIVRANDRFKNTDKNMSSILNSLLVLVLVKYFKKIYHFSL